MPSYVQFSDLPAAALDESKGWIPIKSISHGIVLEIGKFEKGRVRTVNKAEHNDLEFKKPMDRASAFLNVFCSEGRLIATVSFVFSREEEKEVYLKIDLKNVYITETGVDIDDGQEPEETIKLNYQTIDWKYRPKLKTGKLGDWIASGWNRQDLVPTVKI